MQLFASNRPGDYQKRHDRGNERAKGFVMKRRKTLPQEELLFSLSPFKVKTPKKAPAVVGIEGVDWQSKYQ